MAVSKSTDGKIENTPSFVQSILFKLYYKIIGNSIVSMLQKNVGLGLLA